jgi:acetyl esterase
MNLPSNNPKIGVSRDRELLKNSSTFLYKETEQGPLHAHLFFPENHQPGQKSPLMIFFHGGFWDMPAPTQFAPQCMHFASQHFVCLAAETRVASKHKTGPIEAIEDVRTLIDAVRNNHLELGIDPAKIILVGAAGGAFLALQAAMTKASKKTPESPPPLAALILLSALVDTATQADMTRRFPNTALAKSLSPSKMIRKKLPPMLFLHGKADRITPHSAVLSFRRWMKWKGNLVDLVDFEAAEHRFFNFNHSHVHYDLCLRAIESFLKSLQLMPTTDSGEFFNAFIEGGAGDTADQFFPVNEIN